MRYLVTAECVDARTGKRFNPGDEFKPEPDVAQAARLKRAGCLGEVPDSAPSLPVDDLDKLSSSALRKQAKAEGVSFIASTPDAEVAELLRTKRRAAPEALDGLDHGALVERAASLGVSIAEGASDDDIVAAIRTKLAQG